MLPSGNWELWEDNPALGRKVYVMWDGKRWHTRTSYDATQTVEQNKAERNATAGQRFGEWRKVASIPANLAFGYLGDAMDQRDTRAVRKYLNDGDNAAFRTFEGRV